MFKDEQLREAQAWMVRAQEVDAFHLTTNQTLQAEIRERTEQFNQYFLNLQKQVIVIQRYHGRKMNVYTFFCFSSLLRWIGITGKQYSYCSRSWLRLRNRVEPKVMI